MSMINVSSLHFAYEGSYDTIFDNVSFQIDTDWKLGLIGRNGKGKTTFLKLLLGTLPYSGTINATVDLSYFPYLIKNPKKTVIEILKEMNSQFELWELQRELNLLSVKEDVLNRPFCSLSNGEQVKVQLAALFLKENNFLLIDEPTNHLDTEGRKILSRYLNSKKGFILVSHDRFFLDNCVDHILSINRANIEVQKGNFSSWWVNKERQDQYEIEKNTQLKKDIRRLSKASRRTAEWSDKVEASKYEDSHADTGYIGHKAAKMMSRSKAIEDRQKKALLEKEKLLKNIESAEDLKMTVIPYFKDCLLELNRVSIMYSGKKITDNISFSLSQGERIALVGKNGSGKTSILKLILGEKIPYRGNLYLGSNLIISYISQDTSYLHGNLTEFAFFHSLNEGQFKTILDKLDFSEEQFGKDIRDFSDGQKKKVLLAKSLCEQAHLYIWDEPLNFIDFFSRIQIENLIRKYQPTMIFVEHDIAFCNTIATKTIFLE